MKNLLLFTAIFLTSQFIYSQWTQQGVDLDGEAANDWSGRSVSMSNDGGIVAIGAITNDGNGSNSGHVRVYGWDGMTWNQLGQDIDGEAANDWSGWSVSLSADGSIVAIGAPSNDGNGSNSGHVRVYGWDGMTWNQLGQDIDGEASGDNSGRSVSLSADGSMLAVGAYQNDGNGSASGHARVYAWDGLSWNQVGADIDGEAAGDQSGHSVSLSADGTMVAIGAAYNDGNGANSGHTRVYEWNGLNWNQLGQDIEGETAGDLSGQSVSLSADGSIVAIGAPHNDGYANQAGHARVYQWDGLNWNQLGQDIEGETALDFSGQPVSLSADGTVVAIGATYNDGNGSNSGHVRVYQWNGLVWNQVDADLDGEDPDDESGYSVSLSADGTMVATGAPNNDRNGSNSGHVRVYRNPTLVGSSYTAILDANFEQALIDQGIDSEAALDGQVLTANISGITYLDVSNNNIADLTGIGAFTTLETLYCGSNDLSSLHLTQNPGLTELYCQNNQLIRLEVDGLTTLANFNATGNPGLLCIRVTDAAGANAGTGIYAAWVKDDTASYSENCIVDPQGNTWLQQDSNIDGEAAGDQSGHSVSLSADGTVVAIGTTQNDGNGSNSGHVRVYQWNGLVWNQLGADIDGEAAGDQSGHSVSLSADGNIVAIGASYNDGNGNASGHVRVYQWDGLVWNQLGDDIDGEAAGDRSGYSVSLSADGNIVAIGAPYNDGNGSYAGHVRIYQWNGVIWNQLGADIDGEAAIDWSGWSVSLSADGSIVAIGARYNDGNGSSSGHVQVYQWDGLVWNQLGADIDGETAGDYSGWSVSLSADGSIVAIGAIYNDGNGANSGHVRVYQWNGMNWSQTGDDIDGEDFDDQSGHSVSLSADGSIVAIGASNNSGNGYLSGHVRVYQWNGMNWNQTGDDIDGEDLADQSGHSVSLSADGSIIAIGATGNDGNGDDSGHVRVYRNPTLASGPYTAIPDTNFEQALISQGIDSEGILDGQALTDDLSGVTALNVANSNIADLTGIEDFAALDTLYCESNLLTTLNVTQNANLSFLSCYNNQITSLDVTQNPGLSTLWTATNQLPQLDISQNPGLTSLRCFSNQLTALDLSQNPALTEVWCYNNQITTLDFTQNPNLIYLYCNTNALETIDVSQNPDLVHLACHENLLTALDVSQNLSLTGLYAHNNPLLSCIEVDNATDATAGTGIYAGWMKDGAAVYSEDCGMMARSVTASDTKNTKITVEPEEESSTANEIVLYPNPARGLLYVALAGERELASVTLYNAQGQQLVRTKSTIIDTAQLPVGIYLATIELKDGTRITKKIIVSGQ